MELIYWLIFGTVSGIIISLLDYHPSDGLLGSVILGISGAVVGGLLGDLVFGSSDLMGSIDPALVVSAGGAILLLIISRPILRI